MHSNSKLTGAPLRAYEAIFRHPIAHNLAWRDVHAMFRQLGQIEEEPNGNFKVTRNGQLLVLHPPRTKDVTEADEIMALRHFLERSEKAPPATNENDGHWLLVIDHHEARIFRSEKSGSVPQRIRAHEPAEFLRHTHDSKDFSTGREKPAPAGFFEPVAKALQDAGRILVFGTGVGRSSEMEQFVAWLKLHHAELAKRIIGTVVVDEPHLTEGQLLAKAREFHTGVAAA